MPIKIAVLAVQGAFIEHVQVLKALGAETVEIRSAKDAQQEFDGLILPGGESTAQAKLLHDLNIYRILDQKIKMGLPVYGTCAGMILLAEKLENDTHKHFGAIKIIVKRNAFGRQSGSFVAKADFATKGQITMPFIRAPYIVSWGSGVEVLAKVKNLVVAARENNVLVTAFHPEVTKELVVHDYFLQMIRNKIEINKFCKEA